MAAAFFKISSSSFKRAFSFLSSATSFLSAGQSLGIYNNYITIGSGTILRKWILFKFTEIIYNKSIFF